MKEIKANEGYYLSDINKTSFFKSVKGVNISEENYIQVPEEEVKEIMKGNDTKAKLNTLEAIDEYSYTASFIPQVINTVPMSNKEALERKSLFPLWSADSVEVKEGEKYQCDDNLWECIKGHTTQEGWKPSTQTASLWKIVDVEHEGTLEDPIPYVQMMALELGKYYTQYEVLYVCIQATNVGLPYDLRDMVANVKVVE